MILLQLAGTAFVIFIACLVFSVINTSTVENEEVKKNIGKMLDNVGVVAFISTVVLIALILLATIWGVCQ